ncbi:toprim domain-containing protein [Priestia megaterium]|uniref:toprim domain-containing protein n=1 Tax=Priestia megaterium TaxID=1404 RepID=UPI003CC5BD80
MSEELNNNYSTDSIESLGILGGVRAKPASIGLENNDHTFVEILANSIDEYREGYGNKIIITKHEDKSVSVQDFGRSVPMDINSKGEYAYKKVFDELWSGGKYSNNNGDGNYLFSLGTNGCGSTGTNYTSDFFEATAIAPNGYKYYIKYEKGLQQTELLKEKHELSYTGTIIRWLPSKEVFRGLSEINDTFIHNKLKEQSIVNKGLKFIFINELKNETTDYYYENGVIDYITELNEDKNFTDIIQWESESKGRDNADTDEYRLKTELTFCFNNEVNHMQYFHNSSWLANGGTPEEFIKNSFTSSIDKMLKDKYTKGEKKVTFNDIRDSLIVISSTYSTISLYSDQTKKAIDSKFMKDSVTEWLKNQLEIYFIENPVEADKIATQILINKRSREKAEKTRLDVKKKLQGTVNNLTGRIDGFVNCRSKDVTKRQLTLVEGKSALGSTKQGRDAEIQAIYALRGKILNCLKADYDKIFKNDIIVDLLKLLGCGVEIKSKHNKDLNNFDINNLKWKEINIVVDSDIDGGHILTLLLTMFYRLTPTLIREGKINVIESPLYEIVHNDKSYFAHSDAEKDSIVKELGNNVVIQRSKGLGENTPEMMWETTMNPLTRKQYTVTEDELQEKYFDLFLGDNLTDRKGYIEDHLHEYLEEALD